MVANNRREMGLVALLLLCAVGASQAVQANLTALPVDGVYIGSGEVRPNSAYLWVKCPDGIDSASYRVWRAGSEQSSFKKSIDVPADFDYTGQVRVTGLQSYTQYKYQFKCGSLVSAIGTFKTAPKTNDEVAVKYVWVADQAGQGWGLNNDLSITHNQFGLIKGGFLFAEVVRRMRPDFVVHQGDQIYADGRIPASQRTPNDAPGWLGANWNNWAIKNYIAVTQEAFFGNWRYNLLDSKWAALKAEVPFYTQWDDHEVTNNWYPGGFVPFRGNSQSEMFVPALKAFYAYNLISGRNNGKDVIYRSFRYGKHLEIFLVDQRTYRGPNYLGGTSNLVDMLGPEQLQWLKKGLKNSDATWKVVCHDDPISIVTGGAAGGGANGTLPDWDAYGTGADAMTGREYEFADLLSFIKEEEIENVVFHTADVHYATAFRYDPATAKGFKNFKPFWEFVIGPVHAGAFGPNSLMDNTFGPTTDFVYAVGAPPLSLVGQNQPPTVGHNMGQLEVSKNGKFLTFTCLKLDGTVIYRKQLTRED